MVDRFVPCASCARHVKASDAACPFCGAATPAATAVNVIANPISRAAVLFVGLTTATACGGETTSPPDPSTSSSSSTSSTTSSGAGAASSSGGTSGAPEPTAVPVYGPAPQPTHTGTSGSVPVYGAGPVDAGKL